MAEEETTQHDACMQRFIALEHETEVVGRRALVVRPQGRDEAGRAGARRLHRGRGADAQVGE
ncbi:MAG: hypothetical protein AAGL66_17750, partial [Pseudomonadota bacterium]